MQAVFETQWDPPHTHTHTNIHGAVGIFHGMQKPKDYGTFLSWPPSLPYS